MDALIHFTRGIAFACLLLLAIRSLHGFAELRAARLLALLSICLAAYVGLPLLDHGPALVRAPAVVLAIAVPPVFWAFCEALFADSDRGADRPTTTRRPTWRTGLVALYLVVSVTLYLLGRIPPASLGVYLPLFHLSYALRIAFTMLAIRAAVAGWRDDLVESRRRLRFVLLLASGAYMLAVLLVELWLRGAVAPQLLEALNSVGLALMLFVVACWFLVTSPLDLFAAAPSAAPEPQFVATAEPQADAVHVPVPSPQIAELSHTESAWLSELRRVIETEHGYRRPDLGIAALAEELRIPEHLLRRLINRRLGYRNFRDFINSYRLEEAARRLREPADERLPILTIALDSGFASIAPFNRAFRARYGMTPSEYRRAALVPDAPPAAAIPVRTVAIPETTRLVRNRHASAPCSGA